MKAIELLTVDFSKYERIMINSVIVYPTKMVVAEDECELNRIEVIGYKGDEEIFFTSYEKDEKISITNNKELGLIAIRKVERRDETN